MLQLTRFIALLSLMIGEPCTFIFAQQKDPAIEEIRTVYQKINSTTLMKETYHYEAEGCVEDGVVEYYFDKQQIVKLIESGAIGDGSWRTEFYYRNGKLIFCFEYLTGGPAEGPEQKMEHRVYVKDGKVIRFMEGQKIIPADSAATDLVATGNKLLEAHATKDFAKAMCN